MPGTADVGQSFSQCFWAIYTHFWTWAQPQYVSLSPLLVANVLIERSEAAALIFLLYDIILTFDQEVGRRSHCWGRNQLNLSSG
jgi:hypothetical protein